MKNKAENKVFPNRGPKFAQPAYAGAGTYAGTRAFFKAEERAPKCDFATPASSIDLVAPCLSMLGRAAGCVAKIVRVLTIPPEPVPLL